MNPRTLLSPLLLLSACTLTEDGTIETTCDELSTCDSIEDGGVVYVERRAEATTGTGEWRAALINGYGELIEEWTGQGVPGPIAYDETSSTVYLAINDSVRILRDNIPPAVPDIPGMTDAIPVEGGVFFAFKNAVGQILDNQLDHETPLEHGTVYHVARAVQPEHLGTLLDMTGDENHLLHVLPKDGDPTAWQIESERLVDVPRNRLFDLFSDGQNYFSCADTGATFLIVPGVGVSDQPERYPNSANFTDLLSCGYRPETDEVVLFSASQGIALMNSMSELNFLVDGPAEGWQIVHGSVW